MYKKYLQFILVCALVSQFLFLLVPWAPFSTGFGNLSDISVDVAFALAGPHFFKTNVQYGPEAIFTYGPLMFLATEQMGKEWLGNWVVLFRVGLAGLTAVVITTMVIYGCATISARVVAIVTAALICVLWSIGLSDWLWVASPIILVVLHRPSKRDTGWLLLAVLVAIFCGIAALVKFTIAVIAGWSFLIVALSDISRRKWPIPSLVFGVSFLLTWTLIAKQHITNLPTWLQLSLNLSSGYSAAMSKGFYAPYDLSTVSSFYLAELALLIAALMTGPKIKTIFFAGLGFIGIKHAFGGNQIEQECVGLLFTALCVALLALRQPVRMAMLRNAMVALSVILASGMLFGSEYVVGGLKMSSIQNEERIAAIKNMLTDSKKANGWDLYRAAVRKAADLPADLSGTTDIYPSKTVIPLSFPNLTYQARPAFLSLNAHTFELAQLNREFLSSGRAPENILFEILADGYNVNRRLPATEDGASWPDIFAKYAVTGETNNLLILKRKPHAADIHFDHFFSGKLAFEQVIDSPAQPMVWAQIDIRHSRLGKLIDVIYKTPRIFIDITTEGGQKLSHELLPELGRAGFLLSPYVGTTANFRDTMIGKPEPRQAVKNFSIRQEDGPDWIYRSAIDVSLSELRFDGTTVVYPSLKTDELTLSVEEIGRNAKDCLFPPQFFQDKLADKIVLMHAPCQSVVKVPPGSKTATVHYGMRDTSFLAADGHTNGASFQISAQTDPNAPFKPVWSTQLNTFTTPADRTMHSVTIPVQDAAVLSLQTGIGSDSSPDYDHTYWGKIEFSRQ